MMQGTVIVPSLNLPPGVIIPPTLDPTPFVSSPKAMELLMSLTPQQMTDASSRSGLQHYSMLPHSHGCKLLNTSVLLGV
mgnify:CR=1 FL=1